MSQKKINMIIQQLQIPNSRAHESTKAYYRYNRTYAVLEVGGSKTLLARDNKLQEKDWPKIQSVQEIYDILLETHIAINHGKRDAMQHDFKNKYAKISRALIDYFLSIC